MQHFRSRRVKVSRVEVQDSPSRDNSLHALLFLSPGLAKQSSLIPHTLEVETVESVLGRPAVGQNRPPPSRRRAVLVVTCASERTAEVVQLVQLSGKIEHRLSVSAGYGSVDLWHELPTPQREAHLFRRRVQP